MQFNKKNYLKYKKQFSLGTLTTESIHPLSLDLSSILKEDLNQAINILQKIDHQALDHLAKKSKEIFNLQKKCQAVLASGNKIYISGCGATGRLALSLEKLFLHNTGRDQVKGFMAGGDYALVKSIERFEDNIEYGERQLEELGFASNDLLLGITEGGETSFVIGSTLWAQTKSQVKPSFLYCNPDEELIDIERCALVLKSKGIEKLNLCVGPMAITGSTRMQATTVQMIAAGFAILYHHENYNEFKDSFFSFLEELKSINLSPLTSFIEKESQLYDQQGIVTYTSSSDVAIAILTDTTERSPTFSLKGFEKVAETHTSLAFLSLKDYEDSVETWTQLLGREPRCLDWKELENPINQDELFKFDISKSAIKRRSLNNEIHQPFKIDTIENELVFEFQDLKARWDLSQSNLFLVHMYIKLILNIHSTLVMGLQGRYMGNMMTYVKPSNLKLVNRAYRYIVYLLKTKNISADEEKIIDLIFSYQEDERNPVVIDVLTKLGFFG